MADYFSSTTLDGWLQAEAIPYFFTRQKLFKKLFEGGNWSVQHGRDGVQWRVRLSGSQMYSYGKFETFTASEGGDFAIAFLPWGSLYTSIAISGKEIERQGQANNFQDGTLTPMHAEILRDLRDDFGWRLATHFTDGDGTDVNGGGGQGILGYRQSVSTTPSSGTYANISRVTVNDHRNQQFAATSGPSGSAAMDAWWAVLNGLYSGWRMMGPRGMCKPDVLIANQGPLIMIKNKYFSQNTSYGGDVKSNETIEGMEIGMPDDDASADTVYQLYSKGFRVACVKPKSEFFKLRETENLESHVHEGDKAVVLRTPDFQLINDFPKANTAITAFA